ncbi:MAG: serine/threonine-protein kinase [Myxococcales bacterium]
MANSDPPVPQGLVAGKFRLTRLLGRGGMGAVWEGTHTTLGSRVAVKFIDAEYAESPEARSRFENEARAAARLRSKHVVEVYDHGVSDDGRPFIVMEFLDGEPLDKRLDRVGRLSAKETAHIVLQVCRGLTKAHAAGIVHRDLKPENVFLVWDEEEGTDVVKVVDFGIAKFSDMSLGSSSATRTGSVLGTPHYMSPEQARGLRSVDARSDLWSVAVIAYRCIVGALPFEGEAVGDLLVKLCTAPIPVPSQLVSDVPPSFDAWLQRALNRDPAQRFANAAQLAESLAAVCGLSLRGQFAHAGGSGAYSALGPSMRPGFVSDATSVSSAHAPSASSASSAFDARPVALATGAPTTQTPSPVKRTGTGAILAASFAALVVLGIGGAVAVKKLTATPVPAAVVPAAPLPAVPDPKPAPVAQVTPAAPVASEPSASAPVVAASAKPMAALPKGPLPARPPSNRPPAKPPAEKPAGKPGNDIGF